jgi:hypothetical protein
VFLVKPRVKIERFYRFEYNLGGLQGDEPKTPESVIAFENRKTSGLGSLCPRASSACSTSMANTRSSSVRRTMPDKPVNLPVELGVSKAMDLGLEIDATFANGKELNEADSSSSAPTSKRASSMPRAYP